MGSSITILNSKQILKHKEIERNERYERFKGRNGFKDIKITTKLNEKLIIKNFFSLLSMETSEIRMKILMDIPLQFQYKTVIIIYSPPLSYLNQLGDYLSIKCHFPLFNLKENEKEINNYYFNHFNQNKEDEEEENENSQTISLSNSLNNTWNNDLKENNSQINEENHQKKKKLSTFQTNFNTNANYHHLNEFINEENELIKEKFLERINQKDCENGFILLNYPQTVSEGESLNNLTKSYKKIVIHIEQDFTVSF